MAWVSAAIVILIALCTLAAVLRLLWLGSAAERRERLAQTHLCPHCDYDLRNVSLWPDRTKKDPTPRCPECGRIITGIAGVVLPHNLPTESEAKRAGIEGIEPLPGISPGGPVAPGA